MAWLPEHDAFVLEQLALLGQRWSAIAKLMPGRTATMIKTRYFNFIRPKQLNEATEDGPEDEIASPALTLPVSIPSMTICEPPATSTSKRKKCTLCGEISYFISSLSHILSCSIKQR